MKILHIVQSMKQGGIEQLVFSMMRADVKHVCILAIESSEEESIRQWPSLALYKNNLFFANKKSGFRSEVIRFIKQVCQEHDVTVIHTHHLGPLIYGSLASQTMKSMKHVHTQHDIWHLSEYKSWLIEYLIFNLKKNIHLVAVSMNVFTELKRTFPKNKISLIYNGVDTNRFKPGPQCTARRALKLPLDSTIIANVARLEKIKGQQYLIQAMTQLPQGFYLAIAGKGSLYYELQNEIESLAVSHRVCLLGQVEAIELLYQASDLFCLPSLNEGLPLSILEAQACNVPVVCSDVGSCSEGVDPGSGCLIPPESPDAIVEACLKLHHVTQSPRAYILARFSLRVLIEKYQQIYTDLS